MRPFQAFVGTFVGGDGASQSGFVTFTFHNTNNFDAYIPVVITCPNTTSISAGAEVNIYRTTDGGLTWETEGSIVRALLKPTAAGQVQRANILLRTGSFVVTVMVGGGSASTWTAQLGTAWVITSIE